MGKQGSCVQGVPFSQDWSSPCSAQVLVGHVLFTLLTQPVASPITLVPPSLGVCVWGGRDRLYIDTNRERRENWLPEYSGLDLHSAASSPSRKRRSQASLTSARGMVPKGGCTLDKVGVVSRPRGRRGVCCSGEGLIQGAVDFAPPSTLLQAHGIL